MRLKLYQEYSRKDIHDIFSPNTKFIPQAGVWGLHGIIPIPDRSGDFVFIVTLGQKQGEHVFDEGITEDGVLSWQSQPKQGFNSPWITTFIKHDEIKNSIYLFFRVGSGQKYIFLGRLKYLSHDIEREYPVYFQWQILNWNIKEVINRFNIQLLPSSSVKSTDGLDERDTLHHTEVPKARSSRGFETNKFRSTKDTDYSYVDAKNRDLGTKGEILVLEYERKFLRELGKYDLSEEVAHIAKIEGDGAGYDIKSYTPTGELKYIEVKTTKGRAETQFYISPNELEFSKTHSNNYYLYRVYLYNSSSNSGKFFILEGDISKKLNFIPTQYRASILSEDEVYTLKLISDN